MSGQGEVAFWSTVAQGASAVLVMIFTGLLVYYSHQGWQVARRSAEAAERAASVAERALEIAERAYVDVTDWQVNSVNPTAKLTCRIHNYGRTPARITVGVLRLRVAGQIGSEAAEIPPRVFEMGPSTVHPTNSISMPLNFGVLTHSEQNAWHEARAHLLIDGHFDYRDAFGHSFRRHIAVEYRLPEGGWREQQGALNHEEPLALG